MKHYLVVQVTPILQENYSQCSIWNQVFPSKACLHEASELMSRRSCGVVHRRPSHGCPSSVLMKLNQAKRQGETYDSRCSPQVLQDSVCRRRLEFDT
ncbi:hypothetical protein BRADI_1g24475v3 [Brachypodium distachyon]|uniref:Uncharacterized protein n=1 Tax=Brachypodium distachyon TaxID=15368 RepID=A0A2K2DKY2_BRADI|nr:hypothetical protein BRADI_1g24475v3 [Brachypodium distachyon]